MTLVVLALSVCGAGGGEEEQAKARPPPEGHQERRLFPSFDYYLDESDPDVVILRRQDGSFVAEFSSWGVTKEGILEAAREDYGAVLEEYEPPGDPATEQEPDA